jgi:hypothetical protein
MKTVTTFKIVNMTDIEFDMCDDWNDCNCSNARMLRGEVKERLIQYVKAYNEANDMRVVSATAKSVDKQVAAYGGLVQIEIVMECHN